MSHVYSLLTGFIAIAGMFATTCGDMMSIETPDSELPVLQRVEPLENDTTVKGWIGPAGDTLKFGRLELRVPEGAVQDSVEISATLPAGPYLQVHFAPENLEFGSPVTLAVDLQDTEALNNSDLLQALVGVYFEGTIEDGVVKPAEVHDIRIEDNWAFFDFDHFSGYCLARG